MWNRREILQGCLLGGISLCLPTVAGADDPLWSATWTVEPTDNGMLDVSVTVTPKRPATLLVDLRRTGEASPDAPEPLEVRVGDGPVEHVSTRNPVTRSGPKWTPIPVEPGIAHTFGPWRVPATTGEQVTLVATIVHGRNQRARLTHTLGKPELKADWKVVLQDDGEVELFVSLYTDRDTTIRLAGGLPAGLQVSGGQVAPIKARDPYLRGGPRAESVLLVADTTRLFGPWRVTPQSDVLQVALALEHDGGVAHFNAELPVGATGA